MNWLCGRWEHDVEVVEMVQDDRWAMVLRTHWRHCLARRAYGGHPGRRWRGGDDLMSWPTLLERGRRRYQADETMPANESAAFALRGGKMLACRPKYLV